MRLRTIKVFLQMFQQLFIEMGTGKTTGAHRANTDGRPWFQDLL